MFALPSFAAPLPREVARVRLLDNSALLFVASAATYPAAQEECKRLGATLASVPNSDVNDLIISVRRRKSYQSLYARTSL